MKPGHSRQAKSSGFGEIISLALDSIPKNKISTGEKFSGTFNPRHLRVLFALIQRPRRREEIDQIAGSSNGPDLISDLRRRGLHIDCQRTPGIDRDGLPVLHGVYALDELDRRKLATWLRQREGATS